MDETTFMLMSLKTELEDKKCRTTMLIDTVNDHKAQSTDMTQENALSRERLSTLEDRMAVLLSNLRQAEARESELSDRLERAGTRESELSGRLERAESTVQELENMIGQREIEMADLRDQLENAQSIIAGLTNGLNGAEETVKELTTKLEEAKSTIADLQKTLEEKEEKIVDLSKDLNDTKEENARLKREVNDLRAQPRTPNNNEQVPEELPSIQPPGASSDQGQECKSDGGATISIRSKTIKPQNGLWARFKRFLSELIKTVKLMFKRFVGNHTSPGQPIPA